MIEVDVIGTPVGPCTVSLREGRVCGVRLGGAEGGRVRRLADARRWIAAWFEGRRPEVPLDLGNAPDFHRRVYEVVRRIPAGRTLTYAEVARSAGSPGAARAVGNAMARNPIALFIP